MKTIPRINLIWKSLDAQGRNDLVKVLDVSYATFYNRLANPDTWKRIELEALRNHLIQTNVLDHTQTYTSLIQPVEIFAPITP
jgi:hypothetical protein